MNDYCNSGSDPAFHSTLFTCTYVGNAAILWREDRRIDLRSNT